MTKVSWKEKFALIVGGAIVGITCLELLLQVYGLVLDSKRAALEPELEGKIRILALGESTTDPVAAPDNKPWTYYLQEKLNRSLPGKNIVVINKGRAGTSTDYMVRELPQYLEQYHPHLVIGMVGINDWTTLKFLHDEDFFSQLKIVRIYKLLTIRKIPSQPPHNAQEELKNIMGRIQDVNILPPEFDHWLAKYPEFKWFGYQQAMHTTFWITRKIADATKTRQDYEVTYRLALKTLELNPTDDLAFMKFLYSADNHKAEAREILRDLVNRDIIPSATNAPFLHLINVNDDPSLMELLKKKGLELKGSHSMENLRKNYQTMAKMIFKSGAELAVMAYPTTNPEIFKALFDSKARLPEKPLIESVYEKIPSPTLGAEFQKITFIGNTNFPQGFDREYYIDQMTSNPKGGGGFGHTTQKGHELIAENAWKALKDLEIFR